MNRIKTALFIDFDNVYLSLLNDYSESCDVKGHRFVNQSGSPYRRRAQYGGINHRFAPGARISSPG